MAADNSTVVVAWTALWTTPWTAPRRHHVAKRSVDCEKEAIAVNSVPGDSAANGGAAPGRREQATGFPRPRSPLPDAPAPAVMAIPTGQTRHGKPKPGPEPLMTIDEVAAYTQLPKLTLYKMRSEGRGPRAAKLGKHLRYRRSDVDAWVSSKLDDWADERADSGR
jgi:excisionase family DNA binding protein